MAARRVPHGALTCLTLSVLTGIVLAAAPVGPDVSSARAAQRDLSSTDYGYSVAISGSTAVVGAPGLNQGKGAIYLFSRSDGKWRYQRSANDPAGLDQDSFGWSVSASSTESVTYIAVGETGFNSYPDVVYVFAWSRGKLRREAELRDPENYYGDNFGSAVAISPSTLVVGAATGYDQQGALYIYSRSGPKWIHRDTFRDPGKNFGDDFGYAVAVSGTSVIATAQDVAYAYSTSTDRKWARSDIIANPADPSDNFGSSVSVDGDMAIIGAPGNETAFSQGAAYIYASNRGKWKASARLVSPHGITDDQFGSAVAVSGSRYLVGAPINGSGNCGKAYEFARTGTTWSDRLTIKDPHCVPGDMFGASVALASRNGVIGAPDNNKAYIRTGLP
jgi:hypothetical protein